MEEYPRLQRLQRMLDVLHRILTEAEQAGTPEVHVMLSRGAGDAGVELSYFRRGERNSRRINLAGELDLSGAEIVSLFRWAEEAGYIRPNYGGRLGRSAPTPMGSLEYLQPKGYELIGELPDPQERLALILEAAIRAVQKDESLSEGEKKKRIDWFEEAKIAIRTMGLEATKAVLRGDIPRCKPWSNTCSRSECALPYGGSQADRTGAERLRIEHRGTTD